VHGPRVSEPRSIQDGDPVFSRRPESLPLAVMSA
jgi:hypothetical protein